MGSLKKVAKQSFKNWMSFYSIQIFLPLSFEGDVIHFKVDYLCAHAKNAEYLYY